MATAMTPHPCKGDTCDKGGCGYNPYASGQRNFWGPGKTVDTSKPFTVVTQFAANGSRLSQITRKYIQNGRQISGGGSISNCGPEGSTGGLAGMGQALGRGSKCLPRSGINNRGVDLGLLLLKFHKVLTLN